jgi:hypothetical protein
LYPFVSIPEYLEDLSETLLGLSPPYRLLSYYFYLDFYLLQLGGLGEFARDTFGEEREAPLLP